MKRLALVLLLLFLCIPVLAGPYATQNVFLVVMDGVRYSETFGDPAHANIPHLWNDLRPQGTLFTNYYNTGVTITRQSHSTMISGTWQTCPNGGSRMTMPTVFDYYRDELGVPQSKTLAVFGKAGYAWREYSSFPTYKDKFKPVYISGVGEGSTANDQKVLEDISEAMDKDHPNLVFANFGYTDHSGHLNNYPNHLTAIKGCDEVLWKLWNKIQSTPGYKDKTTVFFVNDHGRHDDEHGGFQNHGDKCEGCEHIMLLVLGPDTPKGAEISRRVLQVDIAPTIGELLGFQTPLSEGDTIKGVFSNYLGVNKKEARTETAKAALKVRDLASRDMIKVVADHVVASYKPSDLKPDMSTSVLMRGMLMAYDKTKDQRYMDFVKQWLASVPDSGQTAAASACTGSVQLYLSRRTNDQALRQSARADADALARNLEAKKAGDATPDVCAFLSQFSNPGGNNGYGPIAAKAMTAYLVSAKPAGEAALSRMFADAAETAVANPDDAALRKEFVVLTARVLGPLPEEGAVWSDTGVSALNMWALGLLPKVPWWRTIQEPKKGANKKGPLELPALEGMTQPEIQEMAKALDSNAPPKAPRRAFMKAVTQKGKRGRPFSLSLLRYGVDENGAVNSADERMGAGAVLEALCQVKTNQARRAK